jgi:hypothetical protein
LGAVAGANVSREARSYAKEKGFYVISQSGDTVKIDAPSQSPLSGEEVIEMKKLIKTRKNCEVGK